MKLIAMWRRNESMCIHIWLSRGFQKLHGFANRFKLLFLKMSKVEMHFLQ